MDHSASSNATETSSQVAIQPTSGDHEQSRDTRSHETQAMHERLALIVEGAHDGLWDWDLETGTVYFSPRWKEMLGYTDTELRNDLEEWRGRIHPDDLQRVLASQQAYLAGTTPRYEQECRLRHRDGTYRWIHTRGVLSRDADGAPRRLAGWHTDITEQKRVEEELREKEAQYRGIFEATGDGLLINDLDGYVVEANPAVCAMHGYTYEEFIGLHPTDFIHADHHAVFADFVRSIRAGRRFRTHAIDVRKDGTLFHVEVQGTPLMYRGKPHMLGVVRDVTERVEAERQIAEAEEQYRSIFETTSDALIINDLDGNVVEANPAACRMRGCSYEELVGIHSSRFIHTDSRDLHREFLRAGNEGKPFHARAKNLRVDGTVYPVDVQGTPFTFKGQRHVLAVVRDITEQVQAYQMLEQRVAERTRELSTLLDVSHHVASTLELPPLLATILDQLKTLVDYTGAAIITLEDGKLRTLDYRGPVRRDTVLRLAHPQSHPQIVHAFVHSPRPILIDDIRDDSTVARRARASSGATLDDYFGYIRSWMGIPLLVKDRVIGMLELHHKEPAQYTEQHARLALAVANQAAIALDNARLYEQAQDIAALEERQRLARELHDSVSQALYGIALGARTARTLLDRDVTRVAEPLEYVLSLADAGLSEMRALIFELRPESLATEGLVMALTKQAASLRARHGVTVHEELGEEPDVPLDVKQALYRIGQEALHNTVKHARASEVTLRLAPRGDTLVLEVADNGVGFDTAGSYPGHLGLRSMRERAGRLGGTVEMTSALGAGARIRVLIPYCMPV